MEGAPLCPCTDTETSEQEQTLGSWSGFSLKRDQALPPSLQVFFVGFSFPHTELCLSCNISSSRGAPITNLPGQHRSPCSQHSLPAGSQHLTLCSGSVKKGFKVVTIYSIIWEQRLISDFFPLCTSLYQDRIVSNQISLYSRQTMSESFNQNI